MELHSLHAVVRDLIRTSGSGCGVGDLSGPERRAVRAWSRHIRAVEDAIQRRVPATQSLLWMVDHRVEPGH